MSQNAPTVKSKMQENKERCTAFASLAASFDKGGNNPWDYVAQEIRVSDSLSVDLRRTWHLDSSRLRALGSDLPSTALIPVASMDPTSTQANNVRITSVLADRAVSPVPYRTLSAFLGKTEATPLLQWLAIPMNAQEYETSPLVNVQATIPSHSFTNAGSRFNLRQLWPISEISVKCGLTPLSRLSIVLPQYAVSDVVAVRCRVDWAQPRQQLLDLIQKVTEGQSSDAATQVKMSDEQCRAFYGNVDEYCVATVNGYLTTIEKALTNFRTDSKDGWDIAADHWLAGLTVMGEALEAWGRIYIEEEEEGEFEHDEVVRAAENLSTALSKPTDFLFPATIGADGTMSLSLLKSALRENHRAVTIESIHAPFTSEREPNTLGKRSSLILFLLANVMLVAASVDLSWAAITRWLSWLPSADPTAELREPLVALLLIFPAALYGQFFQVRPNSVVGHKAQAGTFAALSTLFALPLFPAALLAAGAGLPLASAVSLGIGVLALLASVGVWRLFSESALRRVRRKALDRRVRTLARERGA